MSIKEAKKQSGHKETKNKVSEVKVPEGPQVPVMSEVKVPEVPQVPVDDKAASADDCKGSLVKRCKCEDQTCTAHDEFAMLQTCMQYRVAMDKRKQLKEQLRAKRGQLRLGKNYSKSGEHFHTGGCCGEDHQRASREEAPICNVENGQETDEFKARAEDIRQACHQERAALLQAQAPQPADQQRLYNDRPLCAVPQTSEPWKNWMPGWQYLSLTVDSGAAETVIPHMLVKSHPIQETQASRSGMNYASATGDPIPNLGEQKLPLLTQEGSLRAMTFQAAPVDRALGSVKRMCTSGHTVVFDDEGSYVLNKLTGEVNWMREENCNSIMDLWIMPNQDQSFQGQR